MVTTNYDNAESTIGVQGSNYGTVNNIVNNYRSVGSVEDGKGDHSRNVHYYVGRSRCNPYMSRDDAIKKLECLFSNLSNSREITPARRRIFVLYGSGGLGKSQVAVAFATDNRHKFWGVFWVDASTREALDRGYAAIAKVGKTNDPKSTLEENAQNGKDWLTHTRYEWLLIVDNADEKNIEMADMVPRGDNGCIVVTSRLHIRKQKASPADMWYHLEELSVERSIEILQILTKNGEEQARKVVDRLGGMPLALVQAGSAMGQNEWSADEYLDEYEHNYVDLMSHVPDNGLDQYQNTVFTTWQVSVGMIARSNDEASRDALAVLEVSGNFYPNDIPFELLSETLVTYSTEDKSSGYVVGNLIWMLSKFGLSQKPTALYTPNKTAPSRLQRRIRSAVNVLSLYSLIIYEQGKDSFAINRIIHDWIRLRVDDSTKKRIQQHAMVLLTNSISFKKDTPDYDMRKRLHQHVDYFLRIGRGKEGPDMTIDTIYQSQAAEKFALVFSENGQYAIANNLSQRALRYLEANLGPKHVETLTCLQHLAFIQEKLGLYNDAAKSSQRALAGRRRIFATDSSHPDRLESLESLATALNGLAKYPTAERINRIVLERKRSRAAAGDTTKLEDDGIAETMMNLSLLFQRRGDYHGASELCSAAVSLRESTLGRDHHDTMSCASTLTLILEREGVDLEKAESQAYELLSRMKRVFGAQHPETFTHMGRLVPIYTKLGRYDLAQSMQKKVLEGRQLILGPDHPDTLVSMNDFGDLLQQSGDMAGAEAMFRDALKGLEDRLGPHHHYALSVKTNLALFLKRQGNLEKAEELSRAVIGAYQEQNQGDLPEALACLNNLSLVLRVQRRYGDAVEYGREALRGYEKIMDGKHPDTLMCLDNLAWTLASNEKYAESEELSRRALDGFREVLGPTSPDTLETMARLGHVLRMQRKFVDALVYIRECCEGFTKLGPESSNHWCFEELAMLEEEMRAA